MLFIRFSRRLLGRGCQKYRLRERRTPFSFYDGIKIISVEARVKKIRGGGIFFIDRHASEAGRQKKGVLV